MTASVTHGRALRYAGGSARGLLHHHPGHCRMSLADREFIGQEWFKFLMDKGIPFAIRVKEEQLIVVEGREYSLRSYLSRCKGERGFTAILSAKAGQPALELHFGARRIKGGELLIVACSERIR